ncbi:MAG: biopolymer transporter ExbD [Candidatus Margulisiibacteriota bacterium]
MSRQFLRLSRRKTTPTFELTALIDIIFILVLFFAVSTSFNQERKALKLTLPSAIAVETPKSSITISIDQNQRVFWNGKRISENTIATRVEKELSQQPDLAIVLQADKRTPYVRVVAVLDAIRRSGGTNVMLEANKS